MRSKGIDADTRYDGMVPAIDRVKYFLPNFQCQYYFDHTRVLVKYLLPLFYENAAKSISLG